MSEMVYREQRDGRNLAGVRCPRCERVLSVEWDEEDRREVASRGAALRIGRCDACFRYPGEGEGGDDLGGYIYVTLRPDGELDVGTSMGDYREGLTVLLSGEARCGCCLVTVVRCGWCSTPVATRHAPLATIDAYAECGYCVHCDRIIGIDVYARGGRTVREFVDRVASPEEVEAERWAAWRDATQAELNDVDRLSSPATELPPEDLDLLELGAHDIDFAGALHEAGMRDGMTWEAWLSTFGRDLPPGVTHRGVD
jgi:DNA-directed RNA polymerase subunit RPC12/RpoP